MQTKKARYHPTFIRLVKFNTLLYINCWQECGEAL